MVFAGQPQLESPVLRHPFLGDVQLGHHLDAGENRTMKLPVDRPHRRLQDTIDPVLDVHGVILRLYMDVARAPLNRRVNDRIDQLDHRREIAGEPLNGQRLVPTVVFVKQLQAKTLGRLIEYAL